MANYIYQEIRKLFDTQELYLKCKKFYFECITKNNFYHDPTYVIEHVSISIILNSNIDYYEIDTKILIVNKFNAIVGYYRYIEDNNGQAVDDFLVGDFG